MNNLIDAYQKYRLTEAGAKVNHTDNVNEIDDLRRRVEVLDMACQALWEILQEQSGFDKSLIFQKMQEIDARDGKLDGKVSPAIWECGQCGRKNNSLRTSCLYCGTPYSTTAAA